MKIRPELAIKQFTLSSHLSMCYPIILYYLISLYYLIAIMSNDFNYIWKLSNCIGKREAVLLYLMQQALFILYIAKKKASTSAILNFLY